jgi:ABC-2 type transport system permease protein
MNTTTSPRPTSLHPAAARSPIARDLRAAVHSEWIKLRSVRSTPIFLGLAFVLGVTMSLLLAKAVKTDPYDHLPFTVASSFLVSSWLTTLFAVVAGTLLFTSEVQHGTLAGALTSRPSKPIIVGAKVCIAAVLGLVMGALGIIGGLVGGVAGGMATGDMSGAASGVAWALVLTTLASVLGLGVGLIVRHSAAAVTSTLVWALAIESILRSMAPISVSRLMPFTAAHGLLGTRSATDTAETLAAGLSNLANAAVIGCWAAVAVLLGTALFFRQDS